MRHYSHIAATARSLAKSGGRYDLAARYLYQNGIGFRTAYFILFGINPMR